MREDAQRWLLQARRDLENARKTIDISAYEVAAVLAHQSVEKYLKAAGLETKRLRPPATHTLMELSEGLGAPPSILAKLRFLNPDYTVARYPDAANGIPYEVYDRPTAEAKVEAAAEVAQWTESLIRS